ncbi:glycosyltransferase 87 family protein [Glycomyces sp. TRM65418]|uniref:glycosyltransferase 87 family protein n=1 Tax=Glycomyces sp. TRM65418 TaxID=2867006 RepID=UPI001CE5BB2E|nr:glycosyltransferase 87 family protein [Glycomyces sp. TRM65418]MCC3764808.1 glycosyltransferase 87 family protein [Glycomyces sp. TRM65418]QZD54459.1 glycosyltransferase 87 family protein [Glycomyces sp. TRM65418]
MSNRPLIIDLVFYSVAALFAGATALWTTLDSHAQWGAIAFGGYLPAAICIAILLTQPGPVWRRRALVALGTALAVTAIPLVFMAIERATGVSGRAQEEVLVVESSGARLLDTGSPYLHADAIAALPEPLLGYNPYQPGMALFGVPAALFGEHWWTDARLYFLLAAVACAAAAVRLLSGGPGSGAGKGPLLRAVQATFIFPVCALTFATGGDDMPVVALMVLALAFAHRERTLAAGLAIGAAAALKLFAWPAAVVIGFLVLYGSHASSRPRGVAMRRYLAGFAVPVAVTMPPVLAVDARGFFDNVIAYGLGHGVVTSPAQSPLPGFLIAEHLPGGELIAPALLGLAALVIAALLWTRPPVSAASAALWCAGGLSTAFMLMPSTRFGYLLYPVVLLGWWLPLRDAIAGTATGALFTGVAEDETAVDDLEYETGPGPSMAVEWWR